MHRLFAAL
jgi:hypothetical protein